MFLAWVMRATAKFVFCFFLADHTAPVFFWTVIELSLAIMSACLPTLRPLFVRYFPTLLSRGTNSSGSSGFGSRFKKNEYVRSDSDNAELVMPVMSPRGPARDLKSSIIQENSFCVESRPREDV